MAAYIIVNVTINDPSRYDEYKQLATPTVEAYGGRFIVRGGATDVLEGEWQPGRVVVLEFPDSDRAKAWWSSPEYAPAKEIRQAIATTDMIVVEGA
jgi:uncharacterized protein (DUF1330 family)